MEKRVQYRTEGVCARSIEVEMDGGVIKSVRFEGGCDGNLQGISALVAGQSPQMVIERMKGISCKGRGTSCPDQLAKALEQIIG